MSKNKRGRNVKEVKHVQTGPSTGKADLKGNVGGDMVAEPMHKDAVVDASAATEGKENPKPVLIKVLKKDAKFRGAREAWYIRLKEFDGKPVEEYVQDCERSCPQLTKNQTKENPTGWVGFFKRQGIMQEVN